MEEIILLEYNWNGSRCRIRAPKGCYYDNNNDNIKYVTGGISIYNTAVLIINNTLYVTLFSDESQTVYRDNFENNNWVVGGSASFSTVSGSYYGRALQGTSPRIYMWAEHGFGTNISVLSNNVKVFTDSTDYYNYITNTYVQYVWTSVPAISGKNGILSLTQIKSDYINDGESVDDATASYFSNAPNTCNAGDIVMSLQPIIPGDPTTVAIKYNIPQLADASYTSIKLVYKKKKIPKSKTDGIAIDLSQSSDSIAVSGLDELTKYYFVIFVEDSVGNKAESEPAGPITTGELVKPFKEAVEVLKQTGTDTFTPVYEWTGKWGKEAVVQIKSGMSDVTDTIAFTDATSTQKATIVSASESDIFTDSVDIELVTE